MSKKKLKREPCKACKGKGEVREPFQKGRVEHDMWVTKKCPRCNGSGKEPLAFE